jgi:hypothetical protein
MEAIMGDRVTVAVQDQGERVYLYGHWSGYEMPETLRVALARRERWDDPPYLTRIIFSTMTAGSEKDATGFGISTWPQDYEYPLLVVDCDKQEVRLEAIGDSRYCRPSAEHQPMSFETYAIRPKQTWRSLDPTNKRFAED